MFLSRARTLAFGCSPFGAQESRFIVAGIRAERPTSFGASGLRQNTTRAYITSTSDIDRSSLRIERSRQRARRTKRTPIDTRLHAWVGVLGPAAGAVVAKLPFAARSVLV
ncbi:hypothetical protein GY45DRAFT_1332218 [Cubamyces sp. BRFM 1775]|nr:hypothetical protein GY45DRAFT_1332218 [Cubamyces sp. BRFM 1775]